MTRPRNQPFPLSRLLPRELLSFVLSLVGWLGWVTLVASAQDSSPTTGEDLQRSEFQALADEIQKSVGQPPQAILPYFMKYPYLRDSVRDAASFTGMDPSMLGGMLFGEMWFTRFTPRDYEGGQTIIDTYGTIGMDAFLEEAPVLRKKGYLHESVKYTTSKQNYPNEAGASITPAEFPTLRDAIFGFAAMARDRRDRAETYLRNRGITDPTFEELTLATNVFYNAQNPSRFLDWARSKTPLAELGKLAPPWREKGFQSRLAAQNAGRALANALLLRTKIYPQLKDTATPSPTSTQPTPTKGLLSLFDEALDGVTD